MVCDSCLSSLKGIFCSAEEIGEKDLGRAVYFPPQRLLLPSTRPIPGGGFLSFSPITNLSCERFPVYGEEPEDGIKFLLCHNLMVVYVH